MEPFPSRPLIGRTDDATLDLSPGEIGRSGALTNVVCPTGGELEQHRAELTRFCHRFLGGHADAEDAVQETMIRAWRARAGFEGRAAVRTWLFVIAANVCRDELTGRQRRAWPTDVEWEDRAAPMPARASVDDPGELAVTRDEARIAFSVAFEHLPPRQRSVLVLRDVLAWRAREVAELLGTTVAAVNSLQQRARRSLALRASSAAMGPSRSVGPVLLTRYFDALEQRDVGRLVALAGHEGTTESDQTPSSVSAASTRRHT